MPLLNDLRYYVYYKSLIGTGRDGRDGTNGAKVCNVVCFTTVSFQYQRHKICHKSQPTRIFDCRHHVLAFAFKQRQFHVTMVTKGIFFQGDKGDTGLSGMDGNAGVKVGRAGLVT